MSPLSYAKRQSKLASALDHYGLHALVVNPGPTLYYLTGLTFHLSERPVIFGFAGEHPPVVVLPELEKGKLSAAEFDLRAHTYGEDPSTWERVFRNFASEARIDFRRVGIEPNRLRVLELRLLERVAPRSAYISGEGAIASLRMIKDEYELRSMRRAVQTAENALRRTIEHLGKGITEREAASYLVADLLTHGSETPLPFEPIVAFGEHSADPHAVAGDRALCEGDMILFDWGARVDGYVSDLTRVFCWGDAPDELYRVAEIVERANQAAFETVRAGVTAADVDRAARRLIEAEGYGPHFVHRTGHGLGLEVHEEPYLRSDNGLELQPGMTCTIEPGIYLPNSGGVRIEDDIVVTANGAERLSQMPRSLIAVDEFAAADE